MNKIYSECCLCNIIHELTVKIQSSRQHKQTDDTDRNSSGIYDAAAVRYIRRKKHAVFNEFRYYEQHPGLDKKRKQQKSSESASGNFSDILMNRKIVADCIEEYTCYEITVFLIKRIVNHIVYKTQSAY